MRASELRLGILSNSHAAALKLGWDLLTPKPEGLSVTFFGIAARLFEGVKPDPVTRRLIPETEALQDWLAMTSGGLRSIAVDDYDVFLVYGLFFTLPRLDRRMSSAVAAAAVRGALEDSLAWTMVTRLRSLTDKPIFLGPEPLPADAALAAQGHRPAVSQPRPHGEICRLFEQRPLQHEVRFFWQPEDTIGPGLTTLEVFSKGSLRLGGGEHKKHDTRHVNAACGARIMQRLVDRLGE